MCRVLEVSLSGYYAWRGRGDSQRSQDNRVLVTQIQQVHQASRQTYGSPRIHAALRQQGLRCNHKRVERLMRMHGLRGIQRGRHHPVTTKANPHYPVAANLLQRDFTATAPNQKWVADITYLATEEGFLYLAGLEDVFSRRLVGWAMAPHLETDLVLDALDMALRRRQPDQTLLHHSDRGSQYASLAYQHQLTKRSIVVSMSRTGNCLDNALMESFWATLKSECATTSFPTRDAARLAIFEFIEVWYNRQRLHSALGFLSPDQFEHRFFSTFP